MPPCAAFECDLTGWTFDMIPTDAPCSAAARAARWPDRPAPITRTSWEGIGGPPVYERATPGAPLTAVSGARASAALERPLDLLDGDHAAQHAVAVDRQQR